MQAASHRLFWLGSRFFYTEIREGNRHTADSQSDYEVYRAYGVSIHSLSPVYGSDIVRKNVLSDALLVKVPSETSVSTKDYILAYYIPFVNRSYLLYYL